MIIITYRLSPIDHLIKDLIVRLSGYQIINIYTYKLFFLFAEGFRNEGKIVLITNETKRVNKGNNTPDNKARHTGLIVHVLPQEKRNIDVIIDVFGLVENGK